MMWLLRSSQSHLRRRILPLTVALLLVLTGTVQAGENILFVKPGDESATQKLAGGFLRDMSAYLEKNVPFLKERSLKGWIANREKQGISLLKSKKPVVAFVSPGFYLQHLRNKSEPVAQMPRYGSSTDRYYLVTAKNGPDSIQALKSKTVHTTFAIDWKYLKSAVFPTTIKPGSYFKLKPANNMADEVFLLTESSADQRRFDALLLDQDMLNFFKQDSLVWPKLKVIWKSGKLPPGLAVLIGPHSPEHREQLRSTLLNMKRDSKGKQLLRLMNSRGFTPVDRNLLNRTAARY
jgi:hypothetical protein